ncbi:MAG: hypothetical protein K1X83_10765 [Oligoflexia bacterium]|nr:hypothetical protein [Oligoflexia bacterium]
MQVFSDPNTNKPQRGVAHIELVIICTLLVVVIVPLLVNVLIPRFMANSLEERTVAGYNARQMSQHDFQVLSLEGFQVTQQLDNQKSVMVNALNMMEQIGGITASEPRLCGVLLESVDGGPASIVPSGATDKNGSDCEDAANPLPPEAITRFESTLDPLQTGTQIGFAVFRADQQTLLRVGTSVDNQNSGSTAP